MDRDSRPQKVLIIDTETTTDPAQSLNFGCWRYGIEGPDGGVQTIAEGLFCADDLAQRDPAGYIALADYVAEYRADVDIHTLSAEPDWRLHFMPLSQFMNVWFWPLAYKHKARVIGFNLPFDMSRLACGWGPARGSMAGGFSLKLWDTNFRPRLQYRALDSKRAFWRFSHIDTAEGKDGYQGDFVDLRTLTWALSGQAHSLASACDAYGVENGKYEAAEHGVITADYITYCRNDVKATTQLYDKVMAEYRLHPFSKAPGRLYSPASVAKEYLRAIGITPPLSRTDVSPEVLGYAQSSFHGGRAECHIRKTPLPVAVLDFTSMYPTVNALMGQWDMLKAGNITHVDTTQFTQDMLNDASLEWCFDPTNWAAFTGIAKILPDGDVLPARAKYAGTWGIGVNHVYSAEPLWYTIPDLIASKILTGKTPQVIEAVHFMPDYAYELPVETVSLRGQATLDPSRDIYRSVIELRAKHKTSPEKSDQELAGFLKVFANSGSYGIFAEFNRQTVREPAGLTIHGPDGGFDIESADPELPGEFAFPPIATCITGAARLMLAMLEATVAEKGGSWVFCDTDSMAIVAEENPETRVMPDHWGQDHVFDVLSMQDVYEIQTRFNALNPYSPELVPDLLKVEEIGICYAISAKRYCIYREAPMDEDDFTVNILKCSQHGLGHLLNPVNIESPDRDWIRQLWAYIVEDHLGYYPSEPWWIGRPAVSSHTVTRPDMLKQSAGLDYGPNMKPASFMLVAHPARLERLDGPISLYTRFEKDPAKWQWMTWINRHTGGEHTVSTRPVELDIPRGVPIQVQTYRDVLCEFMVHPEASFDDRYGEKCTKGTLGLLQRTDVEIVGVALLGKEANRIEDREVGIATHEEATAIFHDPTVAWAFWGPLVLPVIGRFNAAQLANEYPVGVGERQLRRILQGQEPSAITMRALIMVSAAIARSELRARGQAATGNRLDTLKRWQAEHMGRTVY